MIEIEKKFLLTSAQKQSLLHGAHEIGGKAVTDSYYDTEQYNSLLMIFDFEKEMGLTN